MIRTIVTLIAFNLWNIADLFSTRLIFDKFYVLGESKQRQYRYIWVIYSIVVTYVYCMTKIYRPGIICNTFITVINKRMSAYMRKLFLFFLSQNGSICVVGIWNESQGSGNHIFL